MKRIRSAVVGVGYLGRYHADKYAEQPLAQLVGVCDTNAENCQAVAQKHKVPAFSDFRALIGLVDAVSIAIPTQQHFTIAKFFLENGVHVLIEKPMTTTVAEAEELIAIARGQNLVLQVGHLERFNPAIMALDGILNQPQFIESQRLSPYKSRGADVNVVLDLMIHDIEIIQHLSKSTIKAIHANGTNVLTDQIDIANARVQFENGCVASVTASRVSAKPERRMRIFQPDCYVSIDLQEKTLNTVRKGKSITPDGLPNLERETMNFSENDSLKLEIIAFLESVAHGKPPVVSGEDGKQALETALLISSMIHKGMNR